MNPRRVEHGRPAVVGSAMEPMSKIDEEAARRARRARAEAWAGFGELRPELAAPILSSASSPASERLARNVRFRCVDGPRGVLVATDGLSSALGPTRERLALELYTVAPVAGEVPEGTARALVTAMALVALDNGHLASVIDMFGLLPLTLADVVLPRSARERFYRADGTVGVLSGLSRPDVPSQLDIDGAELRLVSLTLLTGSEYDRCSAGGPSGRRPFAEQLQRLGLAGVSSLARASLSSSS